MNPIERMAKQKEEIKKRRREQERAAATELKYAKLAQDLMRAFRAAEAAAIETDDGGTCNMDTAFLYLPRWKAEKVKEAAAAVGLKVYQGIHRRWYLPTIFGQGNRRTAAAEAAARSLNQDGYQAFVSYVMD